MVKKSKIIFMLFFILAAAASAAAQDGRVSLRPVFKSGQQDRYLITASVTTVVTAKDEQGLSSNLHTELTATVLLRTVAVDEKSVSREAIVESINSRATLNGNELATVAPALVGQKIEFTLDPSGNLLKCSIPQEAVKIGLTELLLATNRWFPSGEVAVGQTWQSGGQGPVYSDAMSDLSKGSTTVYKLSAMSDHRASIEGAITLNQSGSSVLTTSEGRTNVNLIAEGKGATRFEYDLKANRVLDGATVTRLEGRLANIAPTAEGEKMRSREGTVVEQAKFSITLMQ